MLDISFKDKKSIELVSYAKKYNASISILIFSMHDEIELIIRYLNEGANGYLPKNSTELEIREALNTFLEKKSYLSQKIKDQIIDSVYLIRNKNPLKKLSNREYEVSKLLIIGKSTSEISNILDLKNSTISTLKGRVFEKLNIQSVVSLVEIFNLYD
jgi:DNA-binding NarL/FixJ family response regulator